jgi:hypothetical protein
MALDRLSGAIGECCMGSFATIFFSARLWALGLAMFVLLAGFGWVGARLRQRRPTGEDGSQSEGHLLAATLALLGLLIGFTFSLALARYEARREMVVTEANAIGTAWLRAGLAGPDSGPRLQAAIARYTDIRLRLPVQGAADAVEAETGRAQSQIWSELRAEIERTPPPIAATIITATNAMFDAASARKAERNARIPLRVIEVVVLFALMSAAIVGYVLGGAGRQHRVVTSILFMLLTLSLLLILDLDRPWTGGITISQQPMADARAAMR